MTLYEALVASPGAALGIMVAVTLLSISLGGYIEQRVNPRVPQQPKPPKLVPYVPEHLAYLAKTFGVDENTPPLNSTYSKLVQIFADKDAEIASLKAELRSAKEGTYAKNACEVRAYAISPDAVWGVAHASGGSGGSGGGSGGFFDVHLGAPWEPTGKTRSPRDHS